MKERFYMEELKLTLDEVRIIETAIQEQNSHSIRKLKKQIPRIAEHLQGVRKKHKTVYVPSLFLHEAIREWENKIINLDIDEVDLIQSVIETNRYKNLLELEKRLPSICGEISLSPMKASRRLEKSMIETYKKLSKRKDLI